MVGVRLDRKRKQNVTVLLKALGWTNEQIREEFGQYESMMLTLEKDHHTRARTTRCSTSTASCVRASRPRVRPPRRC